MTFSPKDSLLLENKNGTLINVAFLSPKEANSQLEKYHDDIREINRKLDNP